jgi:hypothetical protein
VLEFQGDYLMFIEVALKMAYNGFALGEGGD